MKRRRVLTLLGASLVSTLSALIYNKRFLMPTSPLMPTLFIGHGSPMNAISENTFTHAMQSLSSQIPQPRAILMVSAHWMTRGTWVTHMQNPKTIHDFFGFPQELFDIQYPAPGSPEIAHNIAQQISHPAIHLDDNEWGLDHGTWSVLKHIYPKAHIPVIQLSLDMTQGPSYHFELGQKLKELRQQGILIMGSGNIVHNLKRISWEDQAPAFDWALEFDEWVKQKAEARDFNPLVLQATSTEAGRLSIPTPDHYYPLLYILGAADKKDSLYFDIEGMQNASISMRSFRFGS